MSSIASFHFGTLFRLRINVIAPTLIFHSVFLFCLTGQSAHQSWHLGGHLESGMCGAIAPPAKCKSGPIIFSHWKNLDKNILKQRNEQWESTVASPRTLARGMIAIIQTTNVTTGLQHGDASANGTSRRRIIIQLLVNIW